MDKKLIIPILTIIGALAAVVGLYLGGIYLPRPDAPLPIPPINPEDARLFTLIKTMISFVNTALIAFLLAMYISIYRKMKTEFTLGLILVMFAFLLYALTSNPLLHMLFGFYTGTLGPFTMIPDIFTSFALVVLIFITLE
ncbi:MAG: hypothetical protein ACTSUB_07425 [Candidatus Thorarchaeota archaeon]